MTEQQPQTADGDIWVRLRQRIGELCSEDRSQVDAEALANKLAKRAKVFRRRIGKGAEPPGPQISCLAFAHGRQRYGIPVSDIIEVQPLGDYTPIPGAPAFIPGVIHWRGAILSLVDLVKLFGIAESGLVDQRMCLIVEAAARRIGILAAEVEEFVTVPVDHLKPAPELAADVPPEWVFGVYDQNRLFLRVAQMLGDPRLVDWQRPLPLKPTSREI